MPGVKLLTVVSVVMEVIFVVLSGLALFRSVSSSLSERDMV